MWRDCAQDPVAGQPFHPGTDAHGFGGLAIDGDQRRTAGAVHENPAQCQPAGHVGALLASPWRLNGAQRTRHGLLVHDRHACSIGFGHRRRIGEGAIADAQQPIRRAARSQRPHQQGEDTDGKMPGQAQRGHGGDYD